MKWYWAIVMTLTILMFGVVVDPGTGFVFGGLVVLSAIWVAADSSSFGWGMFVLLLWIVGFPLYLMQREDRGRLMQEASPTSDPDLQPEDLPEDDASAASECVSCGSTIPAGVDACPACGWSYQGMG